MWTYIVDSYFKLLESIEKVKKLKRETKMMYKKLKAFDKIKELCAKNELYLYKNEHGDLIIKGLMSEKR